MTSREILFLHGFASSGANGTVDILRRAFLGASAADRVKVVAPDIPVDPLEALDFLRALVERDQPALIVGTSMGAMYAQQFHGFVRICVNPCFCLSKKYDILHVGRHKWLSPRQDGALDFHVTKETVRHFEEMEARQFDGVDEVDQLFCHALFGDEDMICLPERAVFEQHYPGCSRLFHGGHRLNADLVHGVLLPAIKDLALF